MECTCTLQTKVLYEIQFQFIASNRILLFHFFLDFFLVSFHCYWCNMNACKGCSFVIAIRSILGRFEASFWVKCVRIWTVNTFQKHLLGVLLNFIGKFGDRKKTSFIFKFHCKFNNNESILFQSFSMCQ